MKRDSVMEALNLLESIAKEYKISPSSRESIGTRERRDMLFVPQSKDG